MYNNYIGDYLYSIYYDEQGKAIKTDNLYYDSNYNKSSESKNTENLTNVGNTKNININDNKDDTKILYEKEINENTRIRVANKGAILTQRSIIGIQKTTDGGKTWRKQILTPDKFVQIHNGAKFIFIN